MRSIVYTSVAFLWATAATMALAEQRIVKQEPPAGGLRAGEVVLVDDGTCPKGEIKEVTGAQNLRVNDPSVKDRKRRCIPLPPAAR